MARILIVEDEAWLADCWRQWLTADGHTVTYAPDAQTALDSIDENPPQAIVLDLLLPYANGVQFLQVLQSHHDLASIPVLLCSSALPSSLPSLARYGVVQAIDKAALSPQILRRAVQGLVHAAV